MAAPRRVEVEVAGECSLLLCMPAGVGVQLLVYHVGQSENLLCALLVLYACVCVCLLVGRVRTGLFTVDFLTVSPNRQTKN